MKRSLPVHPETPAFMPSLAFCLVLFFTACPSTDPAARIDASPEISKDSAAVIPLNGESGAEDTLIECVYKTAADLAAALPQGTILGVLSIASAETTEGDFAEELLIFCLVQAGKYRIVERRDLDVIRREQNFHLSGEVDDETAVSIGRMAGAGVVITGTILPYGEGKFLNTRALDVETAQIRAMSSRPFSSLF